MKESQIEMLFERLGKSTKDVPEDVQKIFSTLVDTTLDYRDRLKKESDMIVTVEDVRIALDWLLEWVQTQRWPASDHLVRIELFRLWTQMLKLH
jgi:hypothetical protein